MSLLKNKVAVVTGSARGIGKAIALKFAHAGANVVVVNTDLTGIHHTVKEIEDLGRKALGVKCNVTDSADVDEMVKKILEVFPTIDILVNNAGVTRDNLMIRMGEEDWDLVLNVNLKGPFLLTKAVSRIMMKQRYGRIVNVSSLVGITGNAGQVNYAASKGGLIAFTRSVARELASRHITCNAVAPGFIKTAMTDHLSEEVKANYLKSIPLQRLGNAEDIANVVSFLASDEASYITGQVISVDGGMFMG
jgi:3-oxoacyl-[acyl-carrier protein] reductase